MKTKVIALSMLVLVSVSSFAQGSGKRFAVELNGGASMAIKKLDDAALKPGFGFEGTLHYRFLPTLGAYAGWGWNRFAAEESFAGAGVCFEETGYVIGLNYNSPLGSSKMAWYARAGALYNHIETENATGEIVNDTKHGWGYQVAAGIDIQIGRNLSLTPGVKFNALSRDTEFEGTSITLDHKYLSARIGISKRF